MNRPSCFLNEHVEDGGGGWEREPPVVRVQGLAQDVEGPPQLEDAPQIEARPLHGASRGTVDQPNDIDGPPEPGPLGAPAIRCPRHPFEEPPLPLRGSPPSVESRVLYGEPVLGRRGWILRHPAERGIKAPQSAENLAAFALVTESKRLTAWSG
jgi:hypothetical protein